MPKKNEVDKAGLAKRKRLAAKIAKKLRELYPDAGCSLEHHTPFELLVATILSAQCTDVQVNKVTPALFKKFPTVMAFAESPIASIEKAIKSTGFYHNKAKNIKAACQMILERFRGEVPDTMEMLTSLPGVGRKTANVVLGNAFGRNEGFVVDTHVFRLSHRMDLADGTTPEKVEQQLMPIFPQADWAWLSHALVLHGRGPCKARKPDCENCRLNNFCPRIGVQNGS